MGHLTGAGQIDDLLPETSGEITMTLERHANHAFEAYFPSKRDLWLSVVLWVTSIVLVVATLDVINSPMPLVMKCIIAIVCPGTAILSIWILYSTGYHLTSDKLIARCGPFKTVVALDTVEGVSPSRSLLASPACSVDRLHIAQRGSKLGLLVSPLDKREFLQALVDRCSHLTLEGNHVVKSGA